jgi:CP family cyanate transporter-like MFS transporter
LRPERAALLVGLFVAALALRGQVTGVSPLFPDIHAQLHVSHAVVGLLVTIPVLCMGLFAPAARDAAALLGLRRTLSACLLVIAASGLARAAVPGIAGMILLTIPIGIAMGIAGPLLAVFVKDHFADRPAFATGVYATGLQISGAAAALLVVPLATALSGWRAALAMLSAFMALLFLGWVVLTRNTPESGVSRSERLRLPLRSATAWMLMILFGLQAIVFYGIVAWLPDLYVERGWSDHEAALLLAVSSLVGIPTSIVVPWFADRVGSRRAYLVGCGLVMTLALLGIELFPDAAWLWVVCFGGSSGAVFTLCLTLPLDVSDLPASVASVAAMMLFGGYIIAGLGPLLLGVVRDATGSYEASIAVLIVAAAGVVAGSLLLTTRRLAHGVQRMSITQARSGLG